MKNRRTLIAAVLGGGLLLGAAGIGIVYFVVFAGSSPQKLALSSPTPTTSGSASSSASTAGAGTWTVTSGSQAGYRVREQLASLPAPSDAVGRTTAVGGTLTLAQAATGYSVTAANVSVDADETSGPLVLRRLVVRAGAARGRGRAQRSDLHRQTLHGEPRLDILLLSS